MSAFILFDERTIDPRIMDAERLKCNLTHDIMSTYVPKARKLLHLISYVNNNGGGDGLIDDYKRRLGSCLAESIKMNPIPSNVPLFALNSLYVALRHQCESPPMDMTTTNSFGRFVSVIDRWKRIALGLDDAEECLPGVYEEFCRLSSYICFPKHEILRSNELKEVICPLCIIADVYSDIGWTDYVCPKTPGCEYMGSATSKRGSDATLPEGGCEHLLSTKRTVYDRIHAITGAKC